MFISLIKFFNLFRYFIKILEARPKVFILIYLVVIIFNVTSVLLLNINIKLINKFYTATLNNKVNSLLTSTRNLDLNKIILN